MAPGCEQPAKQCQMALVSKQTRAKYVYTMSGQLT